MNNTDPIYNSLMMKTIRKEATDQKPVWLMRQAGRYMKEYREVRAKVDFLSLCKSPELVSKVTCEAQEKIQADAARRIGGKLSGKDWKSTDNALNRDLLLRSADQ